MMSGHSTPLSGGVWHLKVKQEHGTKEVRFLARAMTATQTFREVGFAQCEVALGRSI